MPNYVKSRGPYQVGGTNYFRDLARKAKKPGKRKSKRGNIYYEYRKNRSDMPKELI